MIEIRIEGIARLQLDDYIFTIQPDELEEGYGGGGGGSMGAEHHHIFTYTDDMDRSAEWTAVEYPSDSLAHVTFFSNDFQLIDDFDFDFDHINEDDEDERPFGAEHDPRKIAKGLEDVMQSFGGLNGQTDASQPTKDNEKTDAKSLLDLGVVQRLLPSAETLQAPEQSCGPQWTFEDAKLVPLSNPVGVNALFSTFHNKVQSSVDEALASCATLRNKYPSLWEALEAYAVVIAHKSEQIDGTNLYAEGVFVRAQFEEADARGARPDEPGLELSGPERSSLKRLLTLHAPFVQMTEIGAHLTALANRELQTPAEAAELTSNALLLAEALAALPEVIDTGAITRIKTFLETPDSDPTATKKIAFSIDSLRNITVVAGAISLLRHFPMIVRVGGAGVGASIGGEMGALLGAIVAEATTSRPTNAARARAMLHLEAVERGETALFDPVTKMVRELKVEFGKILRGNALDEWFNALQDDLDRIDPDSLIGLSDVPVTGKYPFYINQSQLEGLGFETSQWRIDEDGMVGVGSNSQDMSVREIIGLRPISDETADEIVFEYSIVTHFAYKAWCDIDALVEAWVHAFAYHADSRNTEIDPKALDQTIASIPRGRDALSERTLQKVDWLRQQVGNSINWEAI